MRAERVHHLRKLLGPEDANIAALQVERHRVPAVGIAHDGLFGGTCADVGHDLIAQGVFAGVGGKKARGRAK